jgi:hypothetical protein
VIASRAKLVGGLAAIVIASAAVGMTGCGASGTHPKSPTAKTASAIDTIEYGSVGTTADLDCGDGKSLSVAGSNNRLTVTGTCASVNIGGSDNRITIAKVDNVISVEGLDDNVTYKDGDPTVNILGSGNKVTKG